MWPTSFRVLFWFRCLKVLKWANNESCFSLASSSPSSLSSFSSSRCPTLPPFPRGCRHCDRSPWVDLQNGPDRCNVHMWWDLITSLTKSLCHCGLWVQPLRVHYSLTDGGVASPPTSSSTTTHSPSLCSTGSSSSLLLAWLPWAFNSPWLL